MLMTTTFFTYADALVKRKRKAGKYSTADLYRASSNWLLRFWGTDKLSFDAITPGMIDRFYDWLLALGHLKTNSVNSYLSSFRAIYHTAVREELAPADRLSPFAHLNLRQEETAKRALRIQTMEEIARMDLSAEPELQAAKDFALFSFLACGMPFIDLAHLTRDNIVDNELVYNRCKTGVLVRVGITPGMQRLFDKYVLSDSRYLFPVLPEKAEGERLHEAYKQALHHYNGCLVEIGLRLSVPVCLTSYVFRHTWATAALYNDTPVAIISQALGHTSERTTRHYLAALDQSRLNSANEIITKGLDVLVGVRV
ncbi:hypothetical protein CE91St1_15190 [Parabacteroides goldsteinii]|uniref:tyrosine-type recombinase/integrase n=1 Tax=Parabacteroides TaxID=375288 RepID=UPI001FBB78DF|nr:MULTISPECIES: site-specific integrase [Parabacteroides]MCM0717099.1 site-specific integrase [Parabacteroides sp. W1-Q-101]GKG72376.1 hypothetical protein CE91St1_15190 [Parabacteroides goldsteinii]GKG78526.1 hypothetical protein CE91St2_17180 [Parabacteroides goldsteinii]